MQRRALLRKAGAGAAALMVTGLAGCSGDNDPDPTETDEPTTTTENETPNSTMTEPEGNPNNDSALENSGIEPYTFVEGESYTYSSVMGPQTTEETWTVTSVSNGEVTVELETLSAGETTTQTISGAQETIFDKAVGTEGGDQFPLLRSALIYPTKGEMTAGNTFTVDTSDAPSEWDSESVEVIGETTINDIPCTEFTVSPDGDFNQVIRVCINEDYPFALSEKVEQNGDVQVDIELIDATRP